MDILRKRKCEGRLQHKSVNNSNGPLWQEAFAYNMQKGGDMYFELTFSTKIVDYYANI